MARIELDDVSHVYGREPVAAAALDPDAHRDFALRHVDLDWADGGANALLGPSGCGKTTILNLVSGLLRPSHGRVRIDGVDVTGDDARRRRVAQVFQFPVCYEQMTTRQNLAFPLKNAGWKRADVSRRVGEVAEVLDLGGVLGCRAGRLSQADKQKVSLGRGIARPDTAAILFDEPLTVIDPKEKYELRRKIKQVQQDLRITMIYVTHDQHEALTFADAVTVMDHGVVVQQGSPEELHRDPATPFVGFFIGAPGMNLLRCRVEADALVLDGHRLPPPPPRHAGATDLILGIRPEFVELSERRPAGAALRLPVVLVEDFGPHRLATLDDGTVRLRARCAPGAAPRTGRELWAALPADALRFYPGEAGMPA